jgi:hypothetical protein
MKRKKVITPELQVRPGARVSKSDAQILTPVLLQMAEENGEVTEEELVKRATPKSSPLHKLSMWEWDDTKAAHLHRLEVARSYIRSFEIVFEGCPPVRAFPEVTINGRDTYVTMQKVLSESDLLEQVLKDAIDQAKAWQRRWEALRQVEKLKPLFSAIDHVG